MPYVFYFFSLDGITFSNKNLNTNLIKYAPNESSESFIFVDFQEETGKHLFMDSLRQRSPTFLGWQTGDKGRGKHFTCACTCDANGAGQVPA